MHRIQLNSEIIKTYMKYAKLISSKGLVCNTFGNIALRDNMTVYTKHRGVSLEEMDESNIVVLDLNNDQLLYGHTMPSSGYRMHKTILNLRPDINATLHLHPNEIISYFALFGDEDMKFVSNDTALVLGKPVKIMAPSANIEIDIGPLKECIHDTNCIIMPQHGITVFGQSLSEAYHRACSIIAEATRLYDIQILSAITNRSIPFVNNTEVEYMYKMGKEFIYGN